VESPTSKPVVSLRAEDPAFEERIDRFVLELAERIDAFQDAESERDGRALLDLAEALGRDAEALGYPSLAAAALRVAEACAEPGSDALHKTVEDLTELGQRVRRGHRSAAG
jgi:biotin carboxylase